jgi:hypothetical protein
MSDHYLTARGVRNIRSGVELAVKDAAVIHSMMTDSTQRVYFLVAVPGPETDALRTASAKYDVRQLPPHRPRQYS